MTLYKWSQTAASDATADSTINWSEGQAPSSVNDSARAMMAATAKYRDDIAGAIVTGGSSIAYTVSSNQGFDTLAHLNGMVIAFSPHVTNNTGIGTSPITLNVDSLGAKPLRSSPGTELVPGTLIQGTPYTAIYNNSDAAFYLHGFYGNPYNIPLAAGLDYWGQTTPNSSFAFPAGQAISRTTYVNLFNIVGTQFGIGDGVSTFNLPNKAGRVSAMVDASSTILTTSEITVGGPAAVGGIGGTRNSTLITGNLPAYTPAGTVALSANGTGSPNAIPSGFASSLVQVGSSFNTIATSQLFTETATFTGTAQGGTSTAFSNTQPTIMCNYIIRIL